MKQRLFPVIRVLGMLLGLFSLTYALPILTSLIANDGALQHFLRALLSCLLAGFSLWWPMAPLLYRTYVIYLN